MDLTGARADVVAALIASRPLEVQQRLDYWRRGGLPTGVGGEHVSRSRSLPLPAFDRFDGQINDWDRQHRAYWTDLVTASVGLSALQAVVLTPIGLAPKEVRMGTSDDPCCKFGCVRPSQRKEWKLRQGLCSKHYQEWLAAGKPDWNVEAMLKHGIA